MHRTSTLGQPDEKFPANANIVSAQCTEHSTEWSIDLQRLFFILAIMATFIILCPSDIFAQQGNTFTQDVITIPWTHENWFTKWALIMVELETERQRYVHTGTNNQERVKKLQKHLEEGEAWWEKESKKREKEKQWAEELEKKYQDAIRRAENAESRMQYDIAKQAYFEAIKLKPGERNTLLDKIADINVSIYCQNAKKYFENKQYAQAQGEYEKALLIKPNSKRDYINGKIAEIKELMLFLEKRIYTQYDYKKIEPFDYDNIDNYIKTELHTNLVINRKNLPVTSVNLVYVIDTLGATVPLSYRSPNKNLNMILERLNSNIKLKPCFINGYSVNAKAEFEYAVKYDRSIVTVNKNTKGLVSKDKDFDIYSAGINREMSSAPFGKYTFEVNRTVINGQVYGMNKLLQMSGTGGPSNAFLSLLVPGLGDHRVGYKNGTVVAGFTYGLIGAGIGCKFYSGSEYKKYHNATEQKAMDEHYKNANNFNQAFYVCVGAGAIVWLCDIICVYAKGAENKRAYNAYKRSHLGAYHNPEMNINGLSYTVNF